MKVQMMKYVCSNNNRECDFRVFENSNYALHFWSHSTCAVESIAWEFVHAVEDSRSSFTAFCNRMSRQYRYSSKYNAGFMSPKLFVRWFISWICAHRIDFRLEVDPWCQHDPKILIGNLLYNLNHLIASLAS